MQSQSAAAAFNQHLEVSTRLGGFDHAECIFLSRHGKIDCIIARNLQEDPRISTALVRLTRGMQESGTKSQAGSHMFLVAQRVPNFLQARFVLRTHLNEGEQCEIIACAETVKMRTKITGKRLVVACSFR